MVQMYENCLFHHYRPHCHGRYYMTAAKLLPLRLKVNQMLLSTESFGENGRVDMVTFEVHVCMGCEEVEL